MPAPKSKPIDHWAALDAIFKKEAEPVGKEWFTIQQFADRYNLSNSQAAHHLGRLEKRGSLESWSGIVSSTRRFTKKFKLK